MPVSQQSSAAQRFDDAAFADLLRGLSAEPLNNDLLAEIVAQVLVSTSSSGVRNAAALALVDLNAIEKIAALTSVMERADLADQIGTLVFALGELGGVLPLSLAVHIIEHASYEAKAEVVLLSRDERLAVPADTASLARAREQLIYLSRSQDDDVRESAGAVLAALNATPL